MKKLIVVLGMHRSGTSALTGALNKCGVGVGDNIIPPQEDNPKGFFEDEAIIDLNDVILHQLNSNWDDIKFNYSGIDDSVREKYKDEIKRVVGNIINSSDNNVFVVKDPRISLLLDIYIPVLDSIDELEVYYIIINRDAREIAASLKKRNDFSYGKSVSLAADYLNSVKQNINKYEKEFLEFEFTDFLDQPEHYIKKIEEFCGIKIYDEKAVNEFLDKKLKHHSADEKKAPDKIRIGVLTPDPPEYACPYIRLLSPVKELPDDRYEMIFLIRWENGRPQFAFDELSQIDICVVQRHFAMFMPFSELLSYLRHRSVKIIYEIDDALTMIPDTNPAAEMFRALTPQIEEYIKGADLVTVSTEKLKEYYSPLNSEVSVIPNYIDMNLFSRSTGTDDGVTKILFSGTITHSGDLVMIEDAILRILKEYGMKVEFISWGNISDRLAGFSNVKVLKFLPEYKEYANKLAGLGADIGLVSLEENTFNDAKSHIKWLEYSLCGIAGIYSRVKAYEKVVDDGETGIFANNSSDAWYEAIKYLIDNPDQRRKIADNAEKKVLAEHTVQKNADKWEEVINKTNSIIPERKTVEPLVSVIIPVYNKVELTRDCIKSIYKNTPGFINYEVIIIDNASTDKTGLFLDEIEKRYTNLKTIRNEKNLGYSGANNQGAKAAGGKYLLLLNNDTVVKPRWMESMLMIPESDETAGAVGAKLLYDNKTIQHAGVVMTKDIYNDNPLSAHHIYHKQYHDDPNVNVHRTYQALTGAALLVRKEAYMEVGMLDEGFWNGYEDVDFCLKLQEKGWKLVYQPDAEIIHYESQSGVERYSKFTHNDQRLKERWLDKIDFDFIHHKDGRIVVADTVRIRSYQPEYTTIIIPVFNQLDYTKLCYDSIVNNTKPFFEIIFVDNASTDGTKNFLRKTAAENPYVRVITNEKNIGFPAAVNQALRLSSGKYVVIANNDIVVTAGWLEKMIEAAEMDKETGIVGPVSNAVAGPQLDTDADYKNQEEMVKYAQKISEDRKGKIVDFIRVAFLCTLIKRDVIKELGALDEIFSPGNFEDDDYCLRAQLAGFKTKIRYDVFIHHFGSKSFSADDQMVYEDRIETNRKIFIEKWGADLDQIVKEGKDFKRPTLRIPLKPEYLEEYLEKAHLAIAEADFDKALEYIDKVLTLPGDKFAPNKLASICHLGGRINLQKQDLDKAEIYFKKEYEYDNRSSRALESLADINVARGDKQKAADLYNAALSIDPENNQVKTKIKKFTN